jgi:organic radical activating enzyme
LARKRLKTPLSAEPRPARPGQLKVTEHYLCEEGEGSTLGALTYLVRLSGCNLRCWWCDSKQSSFYDDEEKMVAAGAIEKAALKSSAAWVSFTGGEPSWRGKAEIRTLALLCRRLRRAGRKIKIETNGLLLPAELKACVDLWSVAPKWDGAKPYAGQRQDHMDYDIAVLKKMAKSFAPGRMQLKFVVTFGQDAGPKATDLKRAAAVLAGLSGAKRPPVFFIPEAYGKGDYLGRCKALGSAVEALAPRLRGWDLRVQPQWHRVLHGDERGR